MTATEFNATLQALGWKQSDFCRRVEVNKSTASRWGQEGPPAWVEHYLGMVLSIEALHRQYVRPAKPAPLPVPMGVDEENAGPLPKSTRAAKALRLAAKLGQE
jgi:hypothetical protein